jgi:DNA-binding transcriptional LysR family regulator
MVYTPGTTYSVHIGAMLKKHHIKIAEPPVCESASAEALLAQIKVGLGAAWIPKILVQEAHVRFCKMPSYFDISYDIVLLRPQRIER